MAESDHHCHKDFHWDWLNRVCVPCEVKPGMSSFFAILLYSILCIKSFATDTGHENTRHCGLGDDGSRHEAAWTPCRDGTFNDGSRLHCRQCRVCPPDSVTEAQCTAVEDTRCQISEAVPPPPSTTKLSTTPMSAPRPIPNSHVSWAAPLVVLIFTAFVGLCAYAVYRKRKRGQNTILNFVRTPSSSLCGNNSSIVFFPEPGNPHLEDILSPDITSAPLHTVLDDLDVLEELVILMDPENIGIKNTKHLASNCSFPSTWINYTYSMKDTKSPLKAVLEGITSKHPDWTVGHLAKLFRDMERYDAIVVLCKLRVTHFDI